MRALEHRAPPKSTILQSEVKPPATIAAMDHNEVMDLGAYLVSGGDRKEAVFARR
jgi:hypothetical protein